MPDELVIPAEQDELVYQVQPTAPAREKQAFGLGLLAQMSAGTFGPVGQVVAWNAARNAANPIPVKKAEGLSEVWDAGFQASSGGLLLRGRRPTVVLDPQHAKWYESLVQGAGQLFGDFPLMLAGGALAGLAGIETGPGAVVAAGAGAFGIPAAVRESLMLAYSLGDVSSAGDFLNRTAVAVANTGTEAVTGGATALVGGKASQYAFQGAESTAAKIVAGVKVAAAETGTMVVTPALMEGRLPEPQEFIHAAVMVGGLHGANAVAGRLMNIYAKTGKTPAEVVADAAKDPSIKEDLTRPATETTEGQVPRAYQETARQSLLSEVLGEGRDLKVQEVVANPNGAITPTKEPNHVNYRFVDGPEDVLTVQARIAEVFRDQIEAQRGTESWNRTQEKAAELLRNRTPEELAGRDMTDLAAEAMAQQAMSQRAAFDMAKAASEVRAAGAEATPQMHAKLAEAIETLALLHAMDQKNAAEIARALNARKAAKQVRELGSQVGDLFAKYGDDPKRLAEAIGELGDADQLGRFARNASRATTWEKVVEAWKAAAVSGPITQMANVMGNTSFLASRPAVDAVAAAVGAFHPSAKERVHVTEPLARVIGDLQGIQDGLKLALIALKDEAPGGKIEHRHSIEGKAGYVVRSPFRALAAGDALFRTMAERGEAYALAARQAAKEGLGPSTREFRERVVELAMDPTPAMAAKIESAGARFVFNAPLGERGRAVQQFVKTWDLQLFVPFIATPGNVFKELARLSPAAPIVKEWRTDVASGGAAAQKAVAEVMLGTALASVAAMLTDTGVISGNGDPDPNKRRVAMASGWQPYSVKINGTWYSYQRLQPLGTLVGFAADMAEVRKHMGPGEGDKALKILGAAFANSVTNQTFLQGFAQLVAAASHPERDLARFLNSLAGSVVPGISGQTADLLDPYKREVSNMRDAIVNRIPGLRESLMPQRDPYGQPVASADRIGGISPIVQKEVSTDKVRTEAARLGVSVAKAPKSVQISAAGQKDIGKVELTPEQRDTFAVEAGSMAHAILTEIVNEPYWDSMSDMEQVNAFKLVFEKSREWGAFKAIPEDQREREIQRVVGAVEERLRAPRRVAK